jgi:hypothetical protein
MKKSLLSWYLFLAAALSVHSQDADHALILKQQRMNVVTDRIQFSKKDVTRKPLYTAMTQYIVESNIYPNQDAIDLLYSYNKDVPNVEILNKPQSFKPLTIMKSPVNKSPRMAMIAQVSPEFREKTFKRETENFQTKLANLQNAPLILPNRIRDSLFQFRDHVLPAITSDLANIEFAQIEYFTGSLHDLNQWLDEYATDPNKVDAIPAIEEIMDDFFVFHMKAQNPKSQVPSHNFQHNKIPGGQQTKRTSSPVLYLLTAVTSLPNADIYVYTRDKNGNWDQNPKQGAFEVYYDHNSVQYRLNPGCDTIGLFRFHPSVPASVLPVLLPEGNICFLLKDLSSGRLFVRPNINLTDNSVIDGNKLIVLCFKGEN